MLAPNSNTAPITYIVIPFLYSAFSLGDAETYLMPNTVNIIVATATPTIWIMFNTCPATFVTLVAAFDACGVISVSSPFANTLLVHF